MDKFSEITEEVLHYYNCEIEAEKRGLTLYQFYKDNIDYMTLSNIISHLYTDEKIDSRLKVKLNKNITYENSSSIDFLEEFKKITKLSEEKICFLINHHLFSLFEVQIENSLLKKLYKPLTLEDLNFIKKEKSDKFILFITAEGLEYFKTIDDNKFEITWDVFYLTLENEEEKNEIQELISSLEDINKDNVNLEITRRLKELLNNQLDIKF